MQQVCKTIFYTLFLLCKLVVSKLYFKFKNNFFMNVGFNKFT